MGFFFFYLSSFFLSLARLLAQKEPESQRGVEEEKKGDG
jgi:hypothetical protein